MTAPAGRGSLAVDHTVDAENRLARAERKATSLFIGTSLVAALVVGSMMISGWGGGVLRDDIEVLFWAGAILGAVGIGMLGIATLVVDDRARIVSLTRAGVILFMVGPVACVTAVFVDYWI